MAQTYKVVGPDGKVTYTDKPPTASAIKAPGPGSDTPSPATNGIPYETRQAMAKYPVTLYSTKNCAACDSARQALRRRGIPFNEFTIGDDTDLAAYRSRMNATALPGVSVGSKNLAGFSPADLSSYLDAAGYPAQTHLSGYAWPPAAPMVPASAKQAAAAEDAGQAPAPAPQPVQPPPSKSGIQF